ncbi:MAG: hypothetical protein V9G04_17205 [Nocardioides sp.]
MEKTVPVTAAQVGVLEVIEAADGPISLAMLESETGLHANTLRGHLAALVSAGKVARVPLHNGRRGRPAWAYIPTLTDYQSLALALADGLSNFTDDGPVEAAVRGGRAWGGRVVAELGKQAAKEPSARVFAALARAGFSPDWIDEPTTIRLANCPLLDAARSHQDVVCGAHLGMIQGVLGANGATLEPFVEGGGCRVRLT